MTNISGPSILLLNCYYDQDAQHELARSAVKSQNLRHLSDYERARHINAIYTEMSLNTVRNKEAQEKTKKEDLETIIREKTKDIVS